MSNVSTTKGELIQEPEFIKKLFGDTRSAWFWLILRIWLGYKWISSSMSKIDNPAWVKTGDALKGFWSSIVVVPEEGRPKISFDWYRDFIEAMLDAEAYTWFGPLVAYGEMIIGIALVLGAFTGIAAFFGGFMNWNFMMAGSASTNPMLFVVALGLIMAWKVSGYIGLDRFLLRKLGTPWKSKES